MPPKEFLGSALKEYSGSLETADTTNHTKGRGKKSNRRENIKKKKRGGGKIFFSNQDGILRITRQAALAEAIPAATAELGRVVLLVIGENGRDSFNGHPPFLLLLRVDITKKLNNKTRAGRQANDQHQRGRGGQKGFRRRRVARRDHRWGRGCARCLRGDDARESAGSGLHLRKMAEAAVGSPPSGSKATSRDYQTRSRLGNPYLVVPSLLMIPSRLVSAILWREE